MLSKTIAGFMTHQIFLSTVTSEFGGLRTRLAQLLGRTKRVIVRHQDDFPHHGVKTLRMLEEQIIASNLVIHVIGKEPGWSPPLDQVESFLARHPAFSLRFPELIDPARAGTISATQWEVWLALFFEVPRVLLFEFPDRLTLGGSQYLHSQRLRQTHHHPKPIAPRAHSDIEPLFDEIFISLLELGVLAEQELRRPFHLPYATLGDMFVGRDTFLSDLHASFQQSRRNNRWPNHVVCGVGGIGKTRMAIEYAHQYADDYAAVLMVPADTPENLRSGLAGLASVLDPNLDPTTTDDVKEQLRGCNRTQAGC
jgi:hypothetical protein